MKTQEEIIKEYNLLLKQNKEVSSAKYIEIKLKLLKLDGELKTLQIKELYANVNNIYKLLDDCIENINKINGFLPDKDSEKGNRKEEINENSEIKNK